MFRRRIVGAIIKRVSEIQNAGLAEDRIKDLNDQINNIIRVKEKWEARILELGGPDYKAQKEKNTTYTADGLTDQQGYMYFGAAKNLNNVKTVFEKETPAAPTESKKQLQKVVDEEYLGLKRGTKEQQEKQRCCNAFLEKFLLGKHKRSNQDEFVKNKR